MFLWFPVLYSVLFSEAVFTRRNDARPVKKPWNREIFLRLSNNTHYKLRPSQLMQFSRLGPKSWYLSFCEHIIQTGEPVLAITSNGTSNGISSQKPQKNFSFCDNSCSTHVTHRLHVSKINDGNISYIFMMTHFQNLHKLYFCTITLT